MVALLLGLFWHPTTSQGRSADSYAAVPLTTESCPAGYTLVKFDSPSGTQTQGPITLVVTSTQDGEPKTVSFTASGGTLVYLVYVKGGTSFRTYDYRPGGTSAGSGLVAPLNPNNNKPYGISHVTFCYGQVTPTNTAIPPTETPVDTPTDTPVLPTETPVNTPTDTPVPPTTEIVPTSTEVESTVVARTSTPTDSGPTATMGNHPVPNCPEGYLQIKFEDPSGTQTQGPITLTVTRSEDGESMAVRFTVADGTVVYIVYVKGGPGYRTYDYRPLGTTSGSGLVAPINPNNGKPYGISHVTFCYLQEGTPTASNTPVVPTSTEVAGTVVVRTPTEVVPTSTAVLGTVVVRTPTSTAITTEVMPTSTEVAGTVVVRTPTEGSGGDLPTPTGIVLPDSVVRTLVPGGSPDSPDSPDSAIPVAATSVVLPSSGTRPSTMPLTAGEDSLRLLRLLIILAFGFMSMGLFFRGFDLRRVDR